MSKILSLHDPRAARTHYLDGTWTSDTMYALLANHAQVRRDAFAVRDMHQRLTWSQLLAQVDRLADELRSSGVQSGDRVSAWLPDRVEIAVVFLACSRNGYVFNPLCHESGQAADVAALLQRIDCRALFVQLGHGGLDFGHAAAPLDRVRSLRAVFELQPGESVWRQTRKPIDVQPPDSAAAMSPSTNADQVVYLAFVSGAVGEPRGIMHSDNTLLANARALVSDWALDDRTVILSLSPMDQHIAIVGLEQALVAGCEFVMTERRGAVDPIDWIEQTGATYVMGVPTHAVDLLRAMEERGQPSFGQVTIFYMAGSPIPREIAARLLQLGVTPQNVYGMTENGSHHYTRPEDSPETITGTCGRSCKGHEMQLFRPDDPDLESLPGEVGEIGGRGGLLMLGYFGDQALTEKSFNAQGWFMSGDLGQLDQQGNLRLVGRKKDQINRGHKVHPARLEQAATRHPSVVRPTTSPQEH